VVYLCVKFTDKTEQEVKKEIEKLENILTAWSLKVTQQRINTEKSVIDLVIDASMPTIMVHVVGIAQARFGELLLESRVVYEY
jgi:hypothetical protein